MEGGSRTLAVVVVHQPDRPVGELPSVRRLAVQVDELVIVHNGHDGGACQTDEPNVRFICFQTNRGTAAAWNAALSAAVDGGFRYLYILDQDSIPSSDAVAAAMAPIGEDAVAAVVQPAWREKSRLDPFPWNTVASGSLYKVDVLQALGGFDERLFVDAVDHELLARLMAAGYRVASLPAATIDHIPGTPRQVRILGRSRWISGHGAERRRLQGHSAGVLVRRYVGPAPAASARLLLRYALIATKDLAAGAGPAAGALVSGLVSGMATGSPPERAAERSCPYCDGPLVGRFGRVPDWRFGTGATGDVYACVECGALAAGRVPSDEEIASWYADYYTHSVEPPLTPLWSRFWPTPRRRGEMQRLRRYLSPPGSTGRFLEVGTGAGERLVELADLGWDVVGQDLDPKAGHVARDRGITVHDCPVADLAGRVAPFDLIGLNHVLEHVSEPGDLLDACSALLAPGGRICVISPNARSLGRLLFGRWWYGMEQPRHLAIPTLESLDRLTARLGLQAICAETVPTNAAVILGGSFARPFEERLPPGRLRRGARFAMACLAQGLGRAATLVDGRLGEEVVWLGGRGGRTP